MDADIHFGEVEETAPESHLRPDRNRHFAVVPYEEPVEGELPIFVDMDALRDMEDHALSDTSVELGGVMLGGQFEDEEGRPFVVVTDSLRAQHYESTKGSFKFTHDTWSQITRQREEFPEATQMVGWYHTHPDWGVFLSGMDMFICDNFFNKVLDVALVIDPCRQDRGMFQWTGDESERVRRTGGFYLISSRFRQQELEFFAAQLEGRFDMSRDPRSTVPMYGGQMPPVVNISESKSSWQGVAVMGMLTMQFLFLALLAWKMLAPVTPAEQPAASSAERAVLDRVFRDRELAPEGLVSELVEQRELNDMLVAANSGLNTELVSLQEKHEQTLKDNDTLGKASDQRKEDYDNMKKQRDERDVEIEKLKAKLAKFTGEDADGKVESGFPSWAWYALGGLAAVLVIAAIASVIAKKRQEEDESEGADSEE